MFLSCVASETEPQSLNSPKAQALARLRTLTWLPLTMKQYQLFFVLGVNLMGHVGISISFKSPSESWSSSLSSRLRNKKEDPGSVQAFPNVFLSLGIRLLTLNYFFVRAF